MFAGSPPSGRQPAPRGRSPASLLVVHPESRRSRARRTSSRCSRRCTVGVARVRGVRSRPRRRPNRARQREDLEVALAVGAAAATSVEQAHAPGRRATEARVSRPARAVVPWSWEATPGVTRVPVGAPPPSAPGRSSVLEGLHVAGIQQRTRILTEDGSHQVASNWLRSLLGEACCPIGGGAVAPRARPRGAARRRRYRL